MQHETKAKLIKYLENGQVDVALSLLKSVKTTRTPRTNSQNASFHLWLNLIEQEAENQGVTWDMLVRHTSQLRVTSEGLKSACKQLIKALWGYTSTTQLKKTGDLDVVIDHMNDWLSKEMEVPAFPHDEEKTLQGNSGYKGGGKVDYPETEYEEPLI